MNHPGSHGGGVIHEIDDDCEVVEPPCPGLRHDPEPGANCDEARHRIRVRDKRAAVGIDARPPQELRDLAGVSRSDTWISNQQRLRHELAHLNRRSCRKRMIRGREHREALGPGQLTGEPGGVDRLKDERCIDAAVERQIYEARHREFEHRD